jgi:hypothetical protein
MPPTWTSQAVPDQCLPLIILFDVESDITDHLPR